MNRADTWINGKIGNQGETLMVEMRRNSGFHTSLKMDVSLLAVPTSFYFSASVGVGPFDACHMLSASMPILSA